MPPIAPNRPAGNRRTQIRASLNQAREALGPGQLGKARTANTVQAKERIAEIQGNLEAKMAGGNASPIGGPAPAPGQGIGPGTSRTAMGQERSGAGISPASQPNLGRQLSSRVSSGAITQGQAQKVASQRALLEKAYGPGWRNKVFGANAGHLSALRKEGSQGDLGAKTALGQAMERRQRFLQQAQAKEGLGVQDSRQSDTERTASSTNRIDRKERIKQAITRKPKYGGPQGGRPGVSPRVGKNRVVDAPKPNYLGAFGVNVPKNLPKGKPHKKKAEPKQAPGPWYPGKLRMEREGRLTYE